MSRLRNPQIITECFFTEKFLTKGVRKSSTRVYYMEMVAAACRYLLEMHSVRESETAEEARREAAQPESFQKPMREEDYYAVGGKANERSYSFEGEEERGTIRDSVSWTDICFGQSVHDSLVNASQNALAHSMHFAAKRSQNAPRN